MLDAHVLEVLAEQRLTPTDVPADGQLVRLGALANMARGVRATDVTDALHPAGTPGSSSPGPSSAWDVFAVDAMTPDPSADPAEVGGSILELNARAEWLHHTFSARGRCHDIGALLLHHLRVALERQRGTLMRVVSHRRACHRSRSDLPLEGVGVGHRRAAPAGRRGCRCAGTIPSPSNSAVSGNLPAPRTSAPRRHSKGRDERRHRQVIAGDTSIHAMAGTDRSDDLQHGDPAAGARRPPGRRGPTAAASGGNHCRSISRKPGSSGGTSEASMGRSSAMIAVRPAPAPRGSTAGAGRWPGLVIDEAPVGPQHRQQRRQWPPLPEHRVEQLRLPVASSAARSRGTKAAYGKAKALPAKASTSVRYAAWTREPRLIFQL
ncbi:MAG: hypothetical protein R3F60_29775 [bacterium]